MCNTLHIFNPGHDLALAADIDNFTPPHAARALRASLDYLPALWADDGDAVLVDDSAHASHAFMRLSQQVAKYRPWHNADVVFVEKADLASLSLKGIDPWGWDRSLMYLLQRNGVDASLMPDKGALDRIREESHRRTTKAMLDHLAEMGTVERIRGETTECRSINEISRLIYIYNKVVVKAPWSCSGRGVRFLDDRLDEHTQGWLRNTLAQQGSVMVEPFYRKALDFGMEFRRHADGRVEFLGLSLFHTVNGAYTGNLLATEAVKRDILSRYVSLDEVDKFTADASAWLSANLSYVGLFGIDMMVVDGDGQAGGCNGQTGGGNKLAVAEINLRRTMGHVALAISPTDDDVRRVMHIETGNIYKLKILRQ